MKLRQKRTQGFTIMANTAVMDKQLSFKAKGVLLYLLSRPDSWEFRENEIASNSSDGRDAIRSALKELETAGYLYRRQIQAQHGHFAGMEYVVSDSKRKSTVVGLSDNGQTDSGQTDSGKSNTNNKEVTKKDNSKTDHSNLLAAPVDTEAVKLANELMVKVRSNYSFIRPTEKQLDNWAKDIEKMHRLDGVEWPHIRWLITWAMQDDFWKQQIRSGAALRKHREAMLVRIKSSVEKNKKRVADVDAYIAQQPAQRGMVSVS